MKPTRSPEKPINDVAEMQTTRSRPLVQILLSTYNGEAFLRPLLQSLDDQTYPELELLVRDDGSADGTVALLRSHQGRVPMKLLAEPRLGLPDTFFALLRQSRPDAELFAFCDQDDVWLPGKIDRAVKMLQDADAERPTLYCGRTRYVDAELRPLGLSEIPCHAPVFRNALLKNVACGCTVVMNRAARDLLLESVPIGLMHGTLHDWWAYLVVSAFGTVLYDPVPMIEYRRHGGNVTGQPRSFAQRLMRRFRLRWRWPHLKRAGDFHRHYGARMHGENLRSLEQFLRCRESVRSRVRFALTADRQRTRLFNDLVFRLLFIAGRM